MNRFFIMLSVILMFHVYHVASETKDYQPPVNKLNAVKIGPEDQLMTFKRSIFQDIRDMLRSHYRKELLKFAALPFGDNTTGYYTYISRYMNNMSRE